MHRFIYPTKDAWIAELTSSQNHGHDEILEFRKDFKSTASSSFTFGVTRTLVQFDLTNVSKSIATGDIKKDAKYFLRLYSTEASELPASYNVSAFPVSESWEEGTGKSSDNPIIKDGVSWKYRDTMEQSTIWAVGNNVTSGSRTDGSGSESNGSGSQYGGVWYTGSGFESSQSFSYESPDINMDVTTIVNKWLSGSDGFTYPDGIDNNGFILVRSGSEENDNSRQDLKFFSRNTNTIYPPKLEIQYDDHAPCTGSNTGSLSKLDVTGSVENYVFLKSLSPSYKETEKIRFRVGARKRFIGKTFSTSVQTITGSYIPEDSESYSIVDLSTGDTIVPFGSFTKLSCDTSGNYFTQDLNTFQPSRVYKILVKVKYDDGQEIIYDDDSFQFKIER